MTPLAILEISMPRMTGLHAAHELRRHRPDVRVLILSMHESERYLCEALKAGASGYVVKTVERHRANILEKLGLRDRVDLTRYAIRRGLVEP
jgi:DNA-binding NarL/FixJ family response regulator